MAVVTKSLLQRLKAVELASTEAALKLWARAPGNPMKAKVISEPWGKILIFAEKPGNTVFNRASASAEGMAGALEQIEAEFEKRNVPPTIEISAGDLEDDFKEAFMAQLVGRGYTLHGVEGLYYGETDKSYAPSPDDVEVAQVSSDEDLDLFLDLYLEGWKYSETMAKIWRDVGRGIAQDQNWLLFIASVAGVPAGCAQLYLHDNVGYFADACVLPLHRRKGCQRALFSARLAASRDAGADLIFSIAEFADQSANNMEAFGLRMAADLWHWRKN